MAARRPLVRRGGRNQQLPPGDTLLGLPVYLPAYTRSGALLKLSLNSNYSLPVTTRAGGAVNVQVVLNG